MAHVKVMIIATWNINGIKARLDAALTPEAVHYDLDKLAFDRTHGLEIVLEAGEEASVFFDIVVRKKHGAAG